MSGGQARKGARYLLDAIPVKDLWMPFRAKCRALQVSARAQILTLMRDWVNRDS